MREAGNSLYVAKQFTTKRISITQAMKNHEFVYEDDEIGIVCPLYCHMPPKMVQEFLKKAKISAKYLFVIFTYGNRKCDAFEWMDAFMKSNGMNCSYIDAVKMVDNFLPSFDMEEQKNMDKDIEGQLKTILSNVKNHKAGYEKTTAEEVLQHRIFTMEMMEELNRRSALAIIHPCRARLRPDNCITGTVAAIYEYPADTTRAVLNMMAHQVMTRYPNIRFVVPHCGSFLPYMLQRFTGVSGILASMGMMEQVDAKAEFNKLWFDIAGDPEPVALDMLRMVADDFYDFLS